MKPTFHRVTSAETGEILRLMTNLYQHEGIPFSPHVAENALNTLLGAPEKGGAWLIRVNSDNVGYFVLTRAFSLEFGGTFALLDELYIGEEWTSRGIGTATMQFVEQQCRAMNANALRLEAATENSGAVRFYERHGLKREARYLMTKRLAPD